MEEEQTDKTDKKEESSEEKQEDKQETEMSIDNEPDKSEVSKAAEKVKQNPWMLASIILGIAVIVLLFMNLRGGITGNVIAGEDAGKIFVDFAESQGVNAELVEVNDEGSFYEVVYSADGRASSFYMTKDGKYFTQAFIPLTGQATQPTQPTQPQQPTDIPKSDKPIVELFVMSFCPFGNRAENTMLPVYNLLKDKVDWNINYIVSVSGDAVRSLHGQPETDQNIREVCVKKEYGLDKFWEFVIYVNENCGRDGSCWEDAAKEAGADVNKIQSCFDEEGLELMKTEAQISDEAGASGSPTLIINGVNSREVYQYENPEAYKQAICSAFNEQPNECREVLEGSTSGSSSGGQC